VFVWVLATAVWHPEDVLARAALWDILRSSCEGSADDVRDIPPASRMDDQRRM
jgi:hypothetical protein